MGTLLDMGTNDVNRKNKCLKSCTKPVDSLFTTPIVTLINH